MFFSEYPHCFEPEYHAFLSVIAIIDLYKGVCFSSKTIAVPSNIKMIRFYN